MKKQENKAVSGILNQQQRTEQITVWKGVRI